MDKNSGMGQGVGAKAVWSDLLPSYYAHPMLEEAYAAQSELVVAAAVRGLGGLENYSQARGLDAGCAYGTTSLKVLEMDRGPSSLLSIDTAEGMVNLFNAQVRPQISLRDYVLKRVGHLPGDWEEVAVRLAERSHSFQGIDTVARGDHEVQVASAWNAPALAAGKPFDFVVMNQVLHWVVAERKEQLEKAGLVDQVAASLIVTRSLVDCLRELRVSLKKGGVLVLGQSSDFVVLDDDLQADKNLLESGLTARPEYWDMNKEINVGLLEEGFERAMPQDGDARTKIFFRSKLSWDVRGAGFELEAFEPHTIRLPHDPVKAMKLRAPMWLGKVPPEKVSFEKRMEIIEAAASRVKPANHDVLTEQFFVIVLRAV